MNRSFLSRSSEGGYALFISVIVLGSVAGVLAVSLLSAGSTFLVTGSLAERGERARLLADACAETALQEVRDDPNYTGSETIVFDPGSCQYTVNDEGGQSRRIEARGEADASVARVIVDVDSLRPEVTVVSWEEVVSF